MSAWRTVLFCHTGVWGDGVRGLLQHQQGFELVATLPPEGGALSRVLELQPDVIFIAVDIIDENVQSFVAHLLEILPDVPLVLLSLSRPQVQVVQAYSLPAHWQELLDALNNRLQRGAENTHIT